MECHRGRSRRRSRVDRGMAAGFRGMGGLGSGEMSLRMHVLFHERVSGCEGVLIGYLRCAGRTHSRLSCTE